MAHRDENGNYHGVDWMHPEDVKDDRDPDDERKFWKEQQDIDDIEDEEKPYKNLFDCVILQHLNDCVDHRQLSLTLDAMTIGGRILALQIWKFYQKMAEEGDPEAVRKCLDIMPHLGQIGRSKYFDNE